jgi:hypothetical protein
MNEMDKYFLSFVILLPTQNMDVEKKLENFNFSLHLHSSLSAMATLGPKKERLIQSPTGLRIGQRVVLFSLSQPVTQPTDRPNQNLTFGISQLPLVGSYQNFKLKLKSVNQFLRML